ncbi:uncharacterized protein LOC129780459 isoform X2 [Toxorhynchites rutilus septentrionalis]|uniref:uncharacterized protein LOC129780459 isoform X2 n=1 Tax=Toxorhynchites rutilus septentrionalis TaxID=329112 RepID=UPI00247B2D55|nr:uncharacterized protein LOC129780459 isoform X2 [Toxorhynchites rutilus septentrionalis]
MFHFFDEIGSIITKMECKLISRYTPLFVLFLASLVNAQTVGRKREIDNLYQTFYYGDSKAEVGKPFSISCIISIADQVEWHKDGEPIRQHSNIRHGKDEHSYFISEMGIAGNSAKVVATISVQRALPKHEGRYKCNSLDTNSFMLEVHRNSSSRASGTSGSSGGSGAGSHESTGRKMVEPMLDKLDEPLVGPQLLVTMKPTLITSIAESHYPLSTAGSLMPFNEHSVVQDMDQRQQQHSQHHHHHHPPVNNKSGKSDDKQKFQHAFKADSVRFMNKNQEQMEKETQTHPNAGGDPYENDQLLGGKVNKATDEDEYPSTAESHSRNISNNNGRDNGNEDAVENKRNEQRTVVDALDNTGRAAHGVIPPIREEENAENDDDDESPITADDSVQELENDGNDNEKIVPYEDDSIFIESRGSIEDSIDTLIHNKSEINGVIRVESDEDPYHRQRMDLRELERLREEKAVLVAEVPTASTSTTALMIVHNTTLLVTTTTAVMTTPASTTAKHVEPVHGHGSEGQQHHHHHHHDREHQEKQHQQQQHSTTAVPDVLHPNYDDPSNNLKYYDIAKALTLGCNITKEGDYELSWSKDGVNVSEIESLKGRLRILKDERKFIITKTHESDAGSYTCSVRALNASKTFNVVANVMVKFESTEIGKTNIVEGETLSLHCIAYGSNPRITWIIGNTSYSTGTEHILLEEDDKGVENARLTIKSIALSDYNDYTCEGRNNATDITGKPAQITMTVRIRGKYAALYVFIGIIAEVILLCLIILICERRRNKTEIEESDTDQSPDQRRRKSSRNYN